MVPFALSYLAVFTIRAEMPEVGREVAAAIGLVALIALARRKLAGMKSAIVAATAGALLAIVQEPARPKARPDPPRSLDARGTLARLEGVVAPGGQVDPRGASFRLAGGPEVRVEGLRATPPPHTTVAVLGRLDARGAILVAAAPEALTAIVAAPVLSPARLFEFLRQTCRERIGAACPPEAARVLLPLLIGDTGLPEDLREDLARTGTLHIVAVSGTHLSLFLAGLRIFTRRLRVLVPMLVLYAGMCAFDPPVLRSLVLAIGFLCGKRLGRALPRGAHLLLSACVVLALDPDAFFDAGFQLSFSAFGGIVALGSAPRSKDPFQEARERSFWKRARTLLAPAARAGGGATLATAPAMIWRFHRISPVGVPATMLLSPFVPILLWLGALIVMFPSVPAFPRLATAVIDGLVRVSAAIAAVPLASVDIPRPHAPAIATFAGTVLAIGLAGGARWSPARISALALSSLLVLVPDRSPPGLYQLAAGRGSATLLVSSDAAVLVDAGPAAARVSEQILELGLKTLDLVVLTHGHADHTGGLSQVLARLDPRRVAAGPGCTGIGERFPERPIETWRAGDSFEKGTIRLATIWPPPDLRASENDRSLVLDANTGRLRALLAGDLESAGLAGLLGTRALSRVDVLLLPHHGSAVDGLADLLLVTRPRFALLSARAGVPAEETLRVLGAARCVVRATYLERTITILDGDSGESANSTRRTMSSSELPGRLKAPP